MRMLFLLCLAFALGAGALAQPQTDRDRVLAVLAALTPGDAASFDAIESKLVALGDALLPAMQGVLTEKRAALTEAERRMDKGLPNDWFRLRDEVAVLDGAAVRLTWKLNPRQRIAAWLGNLQGFDDRPFRTAVRPERVMDSPVARACPDVLWYLVTFRQYPVGMAVPEPLSAGNVFMVTRGGVVTHCADAKALQAACATGLAKIRDVEAGKDAVFTWLTLTSEFSQDGMFRFRVDEPSLAVLPTSRGWLGMGKVLVAPTGGNKGEIEARLTFEADGALAEVTETRNVRAGMRPICQATKLLDADPLVRRMAEQDLLLMGSAAYDYILEQRAKAAPELQAAIDALWARIVAEGR